MECLLPYLRMVTVPRILVGLERMLDCRGVGLARFHYISLHIGSWRSFHTISVQNLDPIPVLQLKGFHVMTQLSAQV